MSDVRKLAKIVADHSRQIKGLSGGPQAAYSSIEGGSMDSYDSDGKLRLRIGAQDDGTQGVKYVQGPPPPRPTAPVVSVDGPVVRVRWDGMLLGGHIPEDFARIDVHFALASDDLEDASAVRGNLATSAGNETVLAATSTGTYRVGLVAMSQSRARSEMSDVTEVEVELVNLKGAIDTAVDNASGGSNHYRPAPPEGTDHTENDLWFDTSVDPETGLTAYTPHRWDEAAQDWVSVGDQRTAAIQDAQDALRVDVDQIITDGSGTTTYWLPTEPDETTDPPPKLGDIWFNTADGNKLSRHDGQGWVLAADERIQTIQDAYDDLSSEVDSVRTSVDGKSRITQSVDAPPAQYDGAVGDRWERMSSMGSGGSLISNWRWNGDVWVSTLLADSVIANLDAAKISTGFLHSDRIEAGSLSADKVIIGAGGNLISWDQVLQGETHFPHRVEGGGGSIRLTGGSGTKGVPAHIIHERDPGDAGANRYIMSFRPSEQVPAIPTRDRFAVTGGEWRFSIRAYGNDSTNQVRLTLIWYRGDGSYGAAVTSVPTAMSLDPQTVAVEIDLPEDAAYIIPYVRSTQPGELHIAQPDLRIKTGATLIEDGAITTDKIAVGAITAESGVVESLDAGDISVGELDAARIGAYTITADKMLVGPRPDSMIVDVAAVTGGTAPHQAVDGSTLLMMPGITGTDGYNPGPHLTARSSASPGSGTNRVVVAFGTTRGGTRAPVEPSTDYALSALVRVGSSRPHGTPNVHWAYTEYDYAGVSLGTTYLWASQTVAAWGWSPLVGEFSTQPATSSVEIQLRCNQPTTDVRIVKPAFRPKVGTTLIEDGAITTDKIAAGAITAESGVVGSLDAGVITVGEMNGARIEAGSIGAEQLAFGAATGDVLSVDALNFKTAVGLDIRGSSFRAGDAVEMTEDFGIRQFGPDGALNVSLPSDGSPAEFRGDLSARTLTATGRMSIQGPGAIASGGVLELESGVVPPISSPSVNMTWGRTSFPTLADKESAAGLAWGDGHWWRAVQTNKPIADGGVARIEKITTEGELVSSFEINSRSQVYGITILNDTIYVLCWPLTFGGGDRYVIGYDYDGVEKTRWVYAYYGTGTYAPGIGNDGTNIVIVQPWKSGLVTWRLFNATTGVRFTQIDTTKYINQDLVGIHFGQFDYEQSRVVITIRRKSGDEREQFLVYNNRADTDVHVEKPWMAANMENPTGSAWVDGRWYSLGADGSLYQYESIEEGRFAGDNDGDWWLATTWWSEGEPNAAQETPAGPAQRFRYLHRARIRHSVSDVPEGVGRIRFYLAKRDSAPQRTDLRWVSHIEATTTTSWTGTIGDDWQTGANPPASNTFATDAPGEIRSAIGGFRVDGAGSGSWGPWDFSPAGAVTGPGTILSGTVEHGPVDQGADADLTITFPAGRFPSPPAVTATSSNGRLTPAIGRFDVTKDSFRLRVWNFSGANNTTDNVAHWIAVEV